MELDENVFGKSSQLDGRDHSPIGLVVFDYDRTLTLETRNAIVNDFVSGWRSQIDPWSILSSGREFKHWNSYGGHLLGAEGFSNKDLEEEFMAGMDTEDAYMQQVMQDYIRVSFNDGKQLNKAMPREEFLRQEVEDPSKRLYHLKHMLAAVRRGLDKQDPPGQMVIMTYNAWGAIFVLNTLIHASISEYFDAIHSHENAVENVLGEWNIIQKSCRKSHVNVSAASLDSIKVTSAGKLDAGANGKPEAVERLYRNHGLDDAVLIDDEEENVKAWKELGGLHVVNLSRVVGQHKLTIEYVKQTEQYLTALVLPPTLPDATAKFGSKSHGSNQNLSTCSTQRPTSSDSASEDEGVEKVLTKSSETPKITLVDGNLRNSRQSSRLSWMLFCCTR
jgi:hypothetical protein